MTRQQMIEVIVTSLMLSKDKSKEDAIDLILRRGWRGYDNFSDQELKHELDGMDTKLAEGLLLSARLIHSSKADEKLK